MANNCHSCGTSIFDDEEFCVTCHELLPWRQTMAEFDYERGYNDGLRQGVERVKHRSADYEMGLTDGKGDRLSRIKRTKDYWGDD